MLRVVAHQSAAAARQYYTEGLKREDYYSQGQEVVGKWHGKAADRLGLEGDVRPEAFAALIENRHPVTGEKLTPRMKADRRVGYDINFHAPKSLSVIQALTGDRRITTAFREAVSETMAELEERVGARIRKGGGKGNRVTGNFAWAEFVHYTARPVGGIPDPHLHVHAFTFNCTFDRVEERWKAAEFHDIKRDAPYSESSFHARLAGKVAALGWQVEHGKHGWEVAGVPRSVIDKFSRRTAQVEAVAAERGIRDAKAKDALGASTREGKRKGLTNEDLRKEWKARLTKEELAALRDVVRPPAGRKQLPGITAGEAVNHAFEKCFAKASVIKPERLAGEALKFGMGQVSPAQVWQELGKRDMILREVKGEMLCATFEGLAEELRLIDFVRTGRGKCAPMRSGKIQFREERLSAEQKRAVTQLLHSSNQVILLRGAAGVGKTTLMKEAVTHAEMAAHVEAAGLQVFAFAPSAAASRGTLRKEGFKDANTIAHLLTNPELQRRVRGQVIWIDEAGLVGLHDLWRVMQLAGKDTRVILTGDQYQHGPVARGDAFRLLQHYAGVPVIEVTEIRRQEKELYKKAVTALSRGNLASAFRQLEALNAFVELEDDAERHSRLAADYMKLGKNGTFPLVVSPTHAEGKQVTDAIREARKQAGELAGEREFVRYRDLRWEDADKRRAGAVPGRAAGAVPPECPWHRAGQHAARDSDRG
jgi:conjugative relaxase-like TrwC/TraI family protein